MGGGIVTTDTTNARRAGFLNHLRSTATLSDAAVRLALVLDGYADPAGLCWPFQSTLANDLGWSIRKVKRTMAELRTAKLVVYEQRARNEHERSVLRLTAGANPVTGAKDVTRGGDKDGPQVVPDLVTAGDKDGPQNQSMNQTKEPDHGDGRPSGFATKLAEAIAAPLDIAAIDKAAAEVLKLGWSLDALVDHVAQAYDDEDRRRGVAKPTGYVLTLLRSKPSPAPKGGRRSHSRGIGTGGVADWHGSGNPPSDFTDRMEYSEGWHQSWCGYTMQPGDRVRDGFLYRAADKRGYGPDEVPDLLAKIVTEQPQDNRPKATMRAGRQDHVAAKYGRNVR